MIKKIIALLLFAVAMVLVPFALPIVVLIVLLVNSVRIISRSGDYDVSGKEAFFYFLGGIVCFFASFRVLNIYAGENGYFVLIAIFCAVTIVAGYFFRKIALAEERAFYMTARMNLLTKFHPHLLIAAGVIRLVIEVGPHFFDWLGKALSRYTDIGIQLGNVFFIVAIVMYIVRTVYIFKENRYHF